MDPQQYCLTWNNHTKNLTHIVSNLWLSQTLTDCTVACEGKYIKAHKLILAASSTYFEDILVNFGSEKEPVIILRDTPYADLCSILEFIYYGEVRVGQADLKSLLATAEILKVKGLSEISGQALKLAPTVKIVKPNVLDEQKNAAGTATTSTSTSTSTVGLTSQSTDAAGKDDNDGASSDSDDMQMVIDEGENEEENNEGCEDDGDCVEDSVGVDESDEVAEDVNGEMRNFDVLTPSISFSEGTSTVADDDSSDDPLIITINSNAAAGYERQPREITSEDAKLLNEIVKLDNYLSVQGRSRSQFWDEPWARRVMELISRNSLDIKNAAELLGVSYAVLYAKYRELYGYRKHPHLGRMKIGARPVRPLPVVSAAASGSGANRAPRRRNAIDWANENVQRVCSLISSRQISIKKGSEMLGIDYSTLYYHLVRNSPGKAAAR